MRLTADTVKFHSKYRVIIFFALFIAFLFRGVVYGQAVNDLNSKKQDNIRQLNYSKTLLEKTSSSKTNTLNQLNLIQRNIELRSEIIQDISDELGFLKNDIAANNIEIKNIEEKIASIKNDYAGLIRSASRNLDNDYALMYLFSSQDFNQAYQRIRYLKFIARYRMQLVENLKEQEDQLNRTNLELAKNKAKNEKLLLDKKRELSALDQDRKQNLNMVKVLQSKEKELKKEIQKRERIQDEIEREIRRIIEEEAAKAKKANKSVSLTPEEKLISSDFTRNMGRLPWPSEKGVVTGKYGEHSHPVLKGIVIKSNGIDINTVEGAAVRSVFDGEVTKVIAILGANYTVIIKHGEFRTVYQNLVDVRVKAGDKVKTKDVLGTVFTDQDGVSKFHFEVWKDKLTQNPESWLSH